ncbi:hypothetical protein [Candidatus Roseilinea sp. NK_OTU-006]|jgi:hypothetical protein|uniref:hypothetical protein n=1 Tax=Candidatus Roseilinea sp. NK_OTU-006 TaxID=2704250 RepID=UPI00145CDD66|nr:hypothetical protein [Candidatus Roseilinea sp. NK_OTU-006]
MKPSTVSSHAQRREQFLALAAQAYEAFETWYDQHPDAAFAEIEALRQALMGRGLEILINQRRTAQTSPSRAERMRYAEFRTQGCRLEAAWWRAAARR